MTQEVLKLSQEALAGLKDVEKQVRELVAENKALKEALAQTELCKYGQEPASCTSNPMDCQCAIDASLAQTQEPVAWRTFDGEGGYEYRSHEDNESYADEWNKRNPNHSGWVDALYPHPQRKPMTDEKIDFHLDKILRAAGTALKHYSMQKTKDDMRQALREALV